MRVKSRAAQILIYGAPLAVLGLAVLAVLNPGILSPDSVDQWSQARGLSELRDWHPVLDTFWIRLWSFAKTPALPIAIQTLAMAAVVGFSFSLQRHLGVPAWVVAPAAVLVAVWPPTVAFDATLWKDVPYSCATLAAIALLYQLWRSPATAGQPSFQVGVGLCVFSMALFRHNGVAAVGGFVAAALMLAPSERRRILVIAAAALGCWVGLNKLVRQVTGVPPIPPGYVAVGYLAAHVATGTPLAPDEAGLLEAMHPLAGGWPYVCGLTDPTVYDGKFTGQVLFAQGWKPIQLAAKLTLRRPRATLSHFACASRFLWDPSTKKLAGASLWIDAQGQFRTIEDGAPEVARPPWPGVRDWLVWSLLRTERPGALQIFWSPALAFYLLLLFAGWVAVRWRQWGPLIVLGPLVSQTIMMALIAPTPHVRYQYAVILAAWVFAPGLAYLALTRTGETTGVLTREPPAETA